MPTDAIPNTPPLYLHVVYQTLGLLVFALVIVPVLILRAVLHTFPCLRPYPTWSLRKDLAVAGGRLFLACTSYFSLPRPHGKGAWMSDSKVHKAAGRGTRVKIVAAPPISDEWITGPAAVAKDTVRPVQVPCFWTFVPSKTLSEGDEHAQEGERVIMYIAGGSWVMGHPQSTMFPYKFAKEAGRRVLAVNHRKALSPDTAFPAQLLDLTAAYAYLLSLGFAPESITLIGDSSGGHLCLALSRYLAELDAARPHLHVGMVGAMLLISVSINFIVVRVDYTDVQHSQPSCDLGHAPHPRSSTDFLVPYLNARAYPSLMRHFPPDARHTSPYFSPAVAGTFSYLAATQKSRALTVWIQYGSVENLRADIDALIRRMQTDGVVVDVDLVAGGVHLDAGMAFALRERGTASSWTRLVDAVKRYA
ncbi:hypothetical protein PHLGIDRAFT_126866 [Phlebiopsis gigantea 11061_1 CR5-6]|uniref:Alpha/beta hydrolase fold-3 domain-containing protein n=1 Tax=Phlebiopsis gigantea (strain 11061_1 CR5-6) TaxID=745531 RepID=A0A0C3S0Y1_PHLG1|nr:hypothetical protein PHLGIDRAFT_126866 [Phlebiopsis gigantea 11061_1 CR5-6]